MVWWDRQLLAILKACNIGLEERMRYMDDIRLWCHSIRLGWRWVAGDLLYCGQWRADEMKAGMTGLKKTLEVMNEICNFLTLTMESCQDFLDRRLPTLDLNI